MRLVVALGDEPFAHLACDVRLRPPDEASGRDLAHHAVGRLGGKPEQRDLVGVLDHPQVAQHRGRQRELDVGAEGRLNAEQVHRQHRVGHRDPRGRGSSHGQLVGVLGLVPGHDLEGRPQPGFGGAALQPGDDDEGLAPGPDDEDRQALERHRLVAGQIAQVGPHADEQRVEAGLPGRSGGASKALGEARGRDDRAGGEGHDLISTGRPSQAATVAGPSSNSLR